MLRDFIDDNRERLEDLMGGIFAVALLIVALDQIVQYDRRVAEHG